MRKFGSLVLAGLIGGLVFFLANHIFFQNEVEVSSRSDMLSVDT